MTEVLEGAVARDLKAGLLTLGVMVDTSIRERFADQPLTLGEFATTNGVTLIIGEDVFVNAPTIDHNPNFVNEATTPYTLQIEDGDVVVVDSEKNTAYPTDILPVPAYHNKKINNTPITNYVATHGDRVRLSPTIGCVYTCGMCNIPTDLQAETGKRYLGPKPIETIVAAARIAMADEVLPANHILISGGTPGKPDFGFENEVYERIVDEFPGVDVEVMMMPVPGLLDARALKKIGIVGVSANVELYGEKIAQKIMGGKAHAVPRELYLRFIADAAQIFSPGRVRSLVLVGLEPMENTLKAVKAIAERGGFPVLSPFRPDPGTRLADTPPPTKSELLETWQRSEEVLLQYPGIYLGPGCIPDTHNTATLAMRDVRLKDGGPAYFYSQRRDIVGQSA